MVRNIDDSTRIESNRQVFRRLALETVDSQDTWKKYSKKDKRMVRNTDDSTRIESNRQVMRRLVLETVDSQDT